MQKLIEARFKKCTLASPDRILVATDLSDLEYLVPHIVAQAINSSAHVTLVNAVLPTDSLPDMTEGVAYIDVAKLNRDVRLMLLGTAREIEAHGVRCDIAVRNGYPARVIVDELARTGATRLIMGTHGRGKLGQLFLGSVAQEMIDAVEVPVCVIRPDAHDTFLQLIPRKILHPVSLMGDYKESVDLALEIAQNYRAELTLLHVLDEDVADTVDTERVMEWAGYALQSLVPNAENLMPQVNTMVRTGKLADEVLRAAEETGSDLIVLGVNGGRRVGPFFAGTAGQVVTRANCPVLTIPHEKIRAEEKKGERVQFSCHP